MGRRRHGPLTPAQMRIAVVSLLLAGSCSASNWFRPSGCTTECDAQHQCVSNICANAWDGCALGESETRRESVPDENNCYDNGCGWGGCDEPGVVEVNSTHCTNLKVGCLGLCQQETCCRLRPQVQCCKRLNCTEDLADCRIPQQRSLGPNNSSRSDVYYTSIASGGSTTFPFYSSRNMSYGSSCDTVRVWGSCTCDDGTSLPGCSFTDSSTWQALDTLDTTGERLPAGLSLTCLVLPRLAPPPPPESTLPAGGGGGGGGGGQEGLPQADPAGDDDDGSGSSGGHHLSGMAIATIVIMSVLGAAVLLGAAFMAFRLRSAAPRSGPSSPAMSPYEPVFTGQSYTPGLVKPRYSLPEPVRRAWAYVNNQLSQLRGEVADGAAAAHAAYSSHRANLEARLATKYPRNGPALPADVEEDELYTLEDLDEPPGPPAQLYSFGRPQQQVHHEVELGHYSDHHNKDLDLRMSSQPLLQQPTPLDHNQAVIHTTAVHLGPPPPAGHLEGQQYHQHHHQGGCPVATR